MRSPRCGTAQGVSFRRAPFPCEPPGPPINVADVMTDDGPLAGQCIWRFDTELTVTGAPITHLQVQVGGVWLEPLAVTQPEFEHDKLRTTYDTAEFLAGASYRIVTTPTGIVEAARIVIPETGTVTSP